MKTKYKITVPEPCHEDWNKMTPDETGRFCNSCVKSVVDFTNMKASEIQQYFVKNQDKSVCGRFKNEQLDSIVIQIPREALFSQIQFHKVFILALLISMPGILTCQTTSGNSQKIGKVEVVNSNTDTSMVDGRVRTDRFVKDDTPMTPERKAKIEKLKKKREELVKQREASKKNNTNSVKDILPVTTNGVVSVEPYTGKPALPKNGVYTLAAVEVKPDFPGGLTKFYDYFKANFKFPEEYKDLTGRVIVSFVVDSDGNLINIKLLRGINPAVNKEVMRVLKTSPKWIPGKLKSKNVKVSYNLPLKITPQ